MCVILYNYVVLFANMLICIHVDIHILDAFYKFCFSVTTVRLTQASRDVDGNTYDCGNNGGPENNIWLSDAVIVHGNTPSYTQRRTHAHRT